MALSLVRGLGLPGDAVKRANFNGFLQGYSAVVADHKLTREEEGKLTDLRKVFEVPDSAVQAQLAIVDQLRRARQVGEASLIPIETVAKLRKGRSAITQPPCAR